MVDIKIDQILRSKRKTVGLTINASAQLIVRAPLLMPQARIEHLIGQKSQWILKKQEWFRRKQLTQPPPKAFVDGEQFLFLGQLHRLEIVEHLPKAIVLDGNLKVAKVVSSNAKDHLKIWYKNSALEYIQTRSNYFCNLTGLNYESLKVNDAKTRWGSCGYKGSLNFSWRIIMSPPRVIDYVIIHELMHLKQRNHSRKFWNEVLNIIPDYKTDEQWLKENAHLLVL